MTEVTNELELLKQKADLLGIPYKGNIGVDSLRGKINARMAGEATKEVSEDESQKTETEQELRDRIYKEKMKLVRCQITNLDPSKSDLRGEILTVANRYLGTVRKFIPFGEQTDGGFHVEQVLLDFMKSKRFVQKRAKTVKGVKMIESRLVPEYAIVEMPPLSPEELKQLADRQAAAATLESIED